MKTVDGTTELQIPPGTQPGDVVVLAKRGVPKLNKPSIRGDHLFTIKVTIPRRVRFVSNNDVFFLSVCEWNLLELKSRTHYLMV